MLRNRTAKARAPVPPRRVHAPLPPSPPRDRPRFIRVPRRSIGEYSCNRIGEYSCNRMLNMPNRFQQRVLSSELGYHARGPRCRAPSGSSCIHPVSGRRPQNLGDTSISGARCNDSTKSVDIGVAASTPCRCETSAAWRPGSRSVLPAAARPDCACRPCA